jgi:mRNA-degrading endonuclease RelE of RelBE toxin-antitoxin system
MSRYEIVLKPSAVKDMDGLRRFDAQAISDTMGGCLGDGPAKESRSRIKRLRGLSDPDYRLRVGEYRVFYSIDETAGRVNVLRVLHKDETQQYYQELKP